MKKHFIIITSMVLILAFIFVGCTKENPPVSNTLPTNEEENSGDTTMTPDILGEIIDVQNEDVLRVLVESDGTIKGQIWMSITDETQFIDPQGSFMTPDDPASLFVIGEDIGILSTGVIMESYPMQGNASIVYLDD